MLFINNFTNLRNCVGSGKNMNRKANSISSRPIKYSLAVSLLVQKHLHRFIKLFMGVAQIQKSHNINGKSWLVQQMTIVNANRISQKDIFVSFESYWFIRIWFEDILFVIILNKKILHIKQKASHAMQYKLEKK